MKIVIIDYKVGNIQSVKNALIAIGYNPIITENADIINNSDGIILPGVGAFESGMKNLKTLGLIDVINNKVKTKKTPILGICLGLQLLAETSMENGIHHGLSLIPGITKKIQTLNNIKIPHIGWNEITKTQQKQSVLFKNLNKSTCFYFAHSFHLETEKNIITSYVNYGKSLVSSIEKENIFGVQFHPEKSQDAGLLLLKNFMDKCIQTM